MKRFFLIFFMVLIAAPCLWAQYDETFPEQNGMKAVRKGKKVGYVNAEGVEVVPCKFHAVGSFNSSGLAWVYDGKKYGIYRRDGKVIVPVNFKALGYFVPERSSDAVLDLPEDASNSYYKVYKDKVGALDLHGYKYLDLIPFAELPLDFSPYIVLSNKVNKDGDGIVDTAGNVVVPVGQFSRVYMPTEGLVPVSKLSKNSSARIKYPKKLEESERPSFAVELTLVGKGKGSVYDVNYYNPETKSLLFKKWLQSNLVSPFVNGCALIANSEVSFFISREGQRVGNVYNSVYPSSGQLMVARSVDDTYCMINLTGEQKSESFAFLSPIVGDRLVAKAVNEKMFGLLSIDGTWIVKNRFNDIAIDNYGYSCVKEMGKWGIIDANGSQVVPCQWNNVIVPEKEGQSLFWVQKSEKGLWYCYSVSKKDFAFADGYVGVRNFDQDMRNYAIVLNSKKLWGCIDTVGMVAYPFLENNVDAVKSAIRRRFSDGYLQWTPADSKRLELRSDNVKKKYNISQTIPTTAWDY